MKIIYAKKHKLWYLNIFKIKVIINLISLLSHQISNYQSHISIKKPINSTEDRNTEQVSNSSSKNENNIFNSSLVHNNWTSKEFLLITHSHEYLENVIWFHSHWFLSRTQIYVGISQIISFPYVPYHHCHLIFVNVHNYYLCISTYIVHINMIIDCSCLCQLLPNKIIGFLWYAFLQLNADPLYHQTISNQKQKISSKKSHLVSKNLLFLII